MPGEPFSDHVLHRYRLQPSKPHDTAALDHPSGHDLRYEARKSGAHDPFTALWYPGLEFYQPTDFISISPAVPVNHRHPDPLVPGRRVVPIPSVYHPFWRRDAELPALKVNTEVLEVDGGERIPFMSVYELPARTDQAAPGRVGARVSKSYKASCIKSSKPGSSSFKRDFKHLKPLITVDASQPSVTPRSPPDEEFGYLCKLIEPGRGPISPPSLGPSPAPPIPPLTWTCPQSTASSTPATPTTPLVATPTIIVTAPDAPPPLPPKPLAYQFTPSIYREVDVESNHLEAISSRCCCQHDGGTTVSAPSAPPALSPKPCVYRPAINYEAAIEAKYRESPQLHHQAQADGSRQEQRPHWSRREGERRVLRVVNPNVPGWTHGQ